MSIKTKAIITVITDLLLIGACLIVFALFHHVIPQPAEQPDQSMGGGNDVNPFRSPKPSATSTVVTPTSSLDPSVTGAVTVEPTPDIYYGQFGAQFGHLFQNEGETVHTANEYRSKDIYINIYTDTADYGEGKVVYHVADIYVRNMENLRSRLAHDTFGRGYTEDVRKLTFESGGIVGLSGDMSSSTRGGIVIRNGQAYSSKPFGDVCVIYWDGTMKTFYEKDFNMEREMNNYAYQAWDFGPKLLGDNGEVLTEFNSSVKKKNPRGVIGYFEPGHYCFVAIDGRGCSGSVGTTMQQTAQLMHDLGCKQAFNLDGGQSAVMAHNNGDGDWKNDFVNVPYNGGRPLSDIIYIAEWTE